MMYRPIRWYHVVGGFLGAVVLVIAMIYCATALGWIAKPAQIYSVNNVEKEYEWFYTSRRGLEAMKANIATTNSRITALQTTYGEDTSKWPSVNKQEYIQLQEAKSQSVNSYNIKCGEYQAKWDNVFHNLVAPPDIPRDCPLIQ